jgi:hypothetical protein
MIRQIGISHAFAAILALAVTTASVPSRSSWSRDFGKNVIVTSKKDYIHLFWNAHDARGRFVGAERRARIVEAAARLVLECCPDTSVPDTVKADIAFIPENDEYGKPNWASLVRVAHFEASRAKLGKWGRESAGSEARPPESLFEKIEVF